MVWIRLELNADLEGWLVFVWVGMGRDGMGWDGMDLQP